MTTLEDRQRCPKCEIPGAPAGVKANPDRSLTYTMQCENNRCRWYNERWIYQVRADGTLVEPAKHRSKMYPELPKGGGDAFLERLDREISNSMSK